MIDIDEKKEKKEPKMEEVECWNCGTKQEVDASSRPIKYKCIECGQDRTRL